MEYCILELKEIHKTRVRIITYYGILDKENLNNGINTDVLFEIMYAIQHNDYTMLNNLNMLMSTQDSDSIVCYNYQFNLLCKSLTKSLIDILFNKNILTNNDIYFLMYYIGVTRNWAMSLHILQYLNKYTILFSYYKYKNKYYNLYTYLQFNNDKIITDDYYNFTKELIKLDFQIYYKYTDQFIEKMNEFWAINNMMLPSKYDYLD